MIAGLGPLLRGADHGTVRAPPGKRLGFRCSEGDVLAVATTSSTTFGRTDDCHAFCQRYRAGDSAVTGIASQPFARNNPRSHDEESAYMTIEMMNAIPSVTISGRGSLMSARPPIPQPTSAIGVRVII